MSLLNRASAGRTEDTTFTLDQMARAIFKHESAGGHGLLTRMEPSNRASTGKGGPSPIFTRLSHSASRAYAFNRVASCIVHFVVSIAALIILSSHCLASDGTAQSLKSRLSALTEIRLHIGVNDVDLYLPTGGSPKSNSRKSVQRKRGKIIAADTATEGTGGYVTYLAMFADGICIPVEIATDHSDFSATIANQPDSGEDALRTVRFFNGDFDGKPASLMFYADRTRDAATAGKRSLVNTHIMVFRIVPDEYRFAFFHLEADFVTTKKYDSADYALCEEFSLSLNGILPVEVAGACTPY